MLLVNSAQVPAKQTKEYRRCERCYAEKNQSIIHVRRAANLELTDPHRYRVRTLPRQVLSLAARHRRAMQLL